MTRRTLIVAATVLLVACQAELAGPRPPADARAYVAASARYHDPQSLWPAFRGRVDVTTLLRSGEVGWTNELYLDRARDTFSRGILKDGYPLLQTIGPDGTCAATWPSPDATEEQRRRNGLLDEPCAYIEWRRRFYDFLVGLPMVALEGEGTFREAVPTVTAFGVECYEVEVRFGDDPREPTWQLYLEPDRYRLRAARFVNASGGGEWIHYPTDVAYGSFRIKGEQAWYDVDGDRLLSRDRFTYRAIE